MIIAVASPKGGVGKTVTAINIAVELYDRGLRPKFLDGEPHGPNAKALAEFESGVPTYKVGSYDDIVNAIEDRPGETDSVVMDLPGI